MKKTAIAIAISAASMQALALSPSVGEPGFSGSVNLGIGGGNVETNFLAEVMGTDLSDKKLSSLDSNDDEDIGMPAVGYDLGWTFASGNTRVSISDDERSGVLDFDPSAKLALRYDNDRFGNFELAGLLSGEQTSTWRDPYKTTEDGERSNSDITNNGGRITWDKIFSSNFEVYIETKEVDIDKERSGQSLDLNARERKLLDRNGDVNKASVGYVFELNDKHTLRPAITYVDYDLDGDAMSKDGVVGELGYGYKADGFNLGLMGKYGKLDGDKTNPIFNDVNDTDTYSIGATMEFPGMFGLDKWVPNIGAVYAKNDSDIDFNDEQVWLVSFSMFRAF
jgi:hypothetical protein